VRALLAILLVSTVAVAREAMAIRERLLGPDHTQVGTDLAGASSSPATGSRC